MNVIIIDDEQAMLFIMTKMLGDFPDMEIVGYFEDTASATRFIEHNKVHVAYVDISMPKENGIQFAERMAQLQPDLYIVFVTSHDQYALHAFELAALDYIMKPVVPERLEKSVNRARAMFHSGEIDDKEPASNQVRVYALGGLEVQTKHGSVKWISRKSAELFGYLLLYRGRMVSRTRIISDVFGDMPQSNAEKYLNSSIYHLRKALEPHGLKTAVRSDAESYRVDFDDAWIDFVEFEERINNEAVQNGSSLGLASEAEKLYVGDLFGEKGFGWALYEVERLSALYASLVKQLVRLLLEQQAADQAIPRLTKLVNRNELDEEAVVLLLRAYAARSDKAALTKCYRRYVRILRKELEVSPSQDITNLYTRLQAELLKV